MRLNHVKPGDIVDVIAPASACGREVLKSGIETIRALGLVPRVAKDIFAPSILFSNSDEVRLSQYKKAIYAPDSSLIWCVRGGYGAIRLMPEIEKWKKPKKAKIFLGYSDITTLHAHLNQRWGWPTLHGPLLDRMGLQMLSSAEQKELIGLLFGFGTGVEFNKLTAMNAAARQKKTIKGTVLGGNMTVLQSGLGTMSALKPGRSMIFFEDLGERPHRVDRMLTQFRQVGWFDRCQAVILGDFLLDNSLDRRRLWSDVFKRFAAEVNVPVIKGVPVGHDRRRNRTMPLGTPAVLQLGANPKLTVDSGIVSL